MENILSMGVNEGRQRAGWKTANGLSCHTLQSAPRLYRADVAMLRLCKVAAGSMPRYYP
ncbi:hypothetical protein [Melaminivora sp.]